MQGFCRGPLGLAARYWPVFFAACALAGPAAWGAESHSHPTVAFIGAYDATGNDSRRHNLEQLFVEELQHATNFVVRTPSELDAGPLGEENRQQLLVSTAPELRLEPYRKMLGDYLLVLRIAPDPASLAGPDIVTLRLVSVSDGLERLATSVSGLDRDSVQEAVGKLNQYFAPPAPVPAPTRTAPSVTARLVHQPIQAAIANVPTAIEAEVEAKGKVDVWLFFRRRGSSTNYTQHDLSRYSGHKYVGALPPMPAGDLEYYLQVTDDDLNVLAVSGSPEAPHRVSITDAVPQRAAPPAQAVAGVMRPAAPTQAVANAAPPGMAWQRKLGWGAVVAGAVALVVGSGLGLAANSQESHIRATYQPGATALQQVKSANSKVVGANALFVSGGAIGVCGAGLVIAF